MNSKKMIVFHKKKSNYVIKITILSIVLMGFFSASSQNPNRLEVISAAGESVEQNSIQLDWTLGELVTLTTENSPEYITQGFHQPLFSVSTMETLSKKTGSIQVYPNPTSDKILIELSLTEDLTIKIQLADSNGKEIWNEEAKGNSLFLERGISDLPPGIYLLNFYFDNNPFIQTHRIIKTD